MAKRDQRWPIWKIVLVLLGLIAAAPAFFVAAHYVDPGMPAGGEHAPMSRDAAVGYTMSSMLKLFGALCLVLALICIGWLVVRYYQSIPAWKKQAKLPAHRRK